MAKKTIKIIREEIPVEDVKVLSSYEIIADNVPASVKIGLLKGDLVPTYLISLPQFEKATRLMLDSIKEDLITEVSVQPQEILDPRAMEEIKARFSKKAEQLIIDKFPNISEKNRKEFAGILVHETIGLGNIDVLLKDDYLEEVVINNSLENIYIYHKKFGWLRTNISIDTESQILNYASSIGRKVGRRITILDPLMDAQLITGDRVNATLFPISTKGNTITIRKFARKPWTVTEFIENNTLSLDVTAFLWLAIQYEMNMIVAGGTATGKTSFLNVLSAFIPPTYRIISIEDTREIRLPQSLHWIPLTTRGASPEGKGEVKMLDLMINSLRMRPDRIIVGEIRRGEEAEVLFEAMHTGHSVYSTLHADTAIQTLRRISNPPISIPQTLLESLHLVVVMHRDRRRNIRRVFEVTEIISGGEKGGINLNTLFRWSPSQDSVISHEKSTRILDELSLHTGMDEEEINKDIEGKKKILEAMVKAKINTVDDVGKIVGLYYLDSENVLTAVNENKISKLLR